MTPFGSGSWEVQIFQGFPMTEDRISAPIKWGTTTLVVGRPEETAVIEPLVYGPVFIHGDNAMLRLQVPAEPSEPTGDGWVNVGYEDVRLLTPTGYEWDWDGEIRVEGWEVGKDGSARWAVWTIAPFNADPDAWRPL